MDNIKFISRIPKLLAVGLLVLPFSPQAQSRNLPTQAVFSYPLHSDAVIVSYAATSEMLGHPDRTPRIQVFGDGRVAVHYPEYMKKAGDYEAYLNQGEMHQLLLSLSGVFNFNPKAVVQSQNAVRANNVMQGNLLRHRSDDIQEKITVQLDEYQESPRILGQSVNFNLSWKNISYDAKEYPGVDALQKLAGARQSIRALLEHDDLVQVNRVPVNDQSK